MKKNDGFVMIEFLTYFLIFSLIIILVFNFIIYFLTNIMFFIENPPLNQPTILQGFNKYLRFADNIYVYNEKLYFSYKDNDYYIGNEIENLVFYKNDNKSFESDRYKILNYNIDANLITINLQDKEKQADVVYSITNIN